jgi:nucleotide-binding universal stress UspA family protein
MRIAGVGLMTMPDVIAVAVDGTPAGHGALALAEKLARQLGAKLSILCTVDAAYALQTRSGTISSEDRIEYPGPAQEQLAAEAIVADALAEARALGIEAEAATLAGNPAREIAAAAERVDASMIVMGHRHLSWLDRLLHPSICWDVLEHSNRPVLVTMDDGHR